MNYTEESRLDPLVERFVLGTMSRRARRRFSRLVDEDPSVAARVFALEEKLLPMAWSLEPVAPSELLWRRIEKQAGLGTSTGSTPSARSRWPWLATAMSLALLVSIIGWWQASVRPPETLALEPSFGIIADADGNPLWVARLYDELSRADITVSMEPEPLDMNDYQLWLLTNDGTPVSVGLLPQMGEATLALDAAAIAAIGNSETLAVSLEPVGGSPQPGPTGPVLYTAALLAP
ncbi:MAG TPA: anti-sigma factor [Gammaproteobacteria bacterium]